MPSNAITLADYPSDIPHPERHLCHSAELFDHALNSIINEKNERLSRDIEKYGETMERKALDSGIDVEYNFKQYCDLKQARNLERAGRREEAAKIFDQYDMYDEARKLRDREKQVLVRRTDISVDLNALLKEVKDGGIVAVYRCPNCGGKLKVGKDTNVESLKVYEHCGSEIETVELVDFLRTALS